MKFGLRGLRGSLCAAGLGAALMLGGCINIPLGALGSDRGKVSMEIVEKSESFWNTNEILMIPLSGMVNTGDMSPGIDNQSGMLVSLKDRLKAAKDDPCIKAVVLRIDSPGGGVTAADLIYREIVQFKQEQHIPVIALMTDTAASGGLYIAMAADEIYALPTTVTGSIGVITMLPGFKGLSDKIGFQMRIIKSGAHKDDGSPWHDLSEAERKVFQDLIDRYYQHFLDVIVTSRQAKGLTREALLPVADGRVLDAQTAVAAKLIDGIKYPDEVFARAKELAGIRDASVISYEYPGSYRGNIYARTDAASQHTGVSAGGDLNLLKLDLSGASGSLTAAQGPRFYYLWQP